MTDTAFLQRLTQAIGERLRTGLAGAAEGAKLPEARRFFRFFALSVLLPSVLAIALMEVAAFNSGAMLSAHDMSRAQNSDPSLVVSPTGGMGRYADYQITRLATIKPEIFYIGPSRCLQVRAAMFKPYAFHNACMTSWNIDQARDMMERALAVTSPSIVIVELDYFMFTDAFSKAWKQNAAMKHGELGHLEALKSLFESLREWPAATIRNARQQWSGQNPQTEINVRLLGPAAVQHASGFRYDGSTIYPPPYRTLVKQSDEAILKGYLPGIHGGDSMDRKQIAALRRLADSARRHNVVLVGIQLPFMRAVTDYMKKAEPSYSGVWLEYESEKTRRMMQDFGIAYFDLSQSHGSADARHFVDAGHPNEAGILASLLELWDDPRFRAIFPRLEPDALAARYKKAMAEGNPFDIYR